MFRKRTLGFFDSIKDSSDYWIEKIKRVKIEKDLRTLVNLNLRFKKIKGFKI